MAIAPAALEPRPARKANPGLAVDPTTGQRYEVKFWASEPQAAAFLKEALHHMQPDPFCKQGPQLPEQDRLHDVGRGHGRGRKMGREHKQAAVRVKSGEVRRAA